MDDEGLVLYRNSVENWNFPSNLNENELELLANHILDTVNNAKSEKAREGLGYLISSDLSQAQRDYLLYEIEAEEDFRKSSEYRDFIRGIIEYEDFNNMVGRALAHITEKYTDEMSRKN